MARNKAKDDLLFNCSQYHENTYISNLYGDDSDEISIFLDDKCEDNTINNFTHMDVYKLIKSKYGYAIPVE